MIDAALKVLIPEDPALNEWERLEKKIRDLSQKRNFLVHYMLIGHIAGESVTLRLSRSVYDLRMSINHEIGTEQIRSYTAAFSAMTKRLEKFAEKLVKMLPR
jgi:hypothetical protein